MHSSNHSTQIIKYISIKSLNLFILFFILIPIATADPLQPKLILQITVDQLRGDLPDKFMKNMGSGGFRYLKEKGIWYNNAHYGHSNTETVVGHTSLATGADPAVHGMVANVWFDRKTDQLVYNIEDPKYHILSSNADVDKSTEIDSSQALANTDGRSPANIMVTTFSDELSIRSNGKAKIIGISVKDRGAVTLAGHAGKAFWFSKSAGQFITSSYYYDTYPNWVKAWNKKGQAQIFDNKAWTLLHDKNTYLFANDDDMPWEMDMVGFGRTFPHLYGSSKGKYYTNYLTFSPAGDELTLDFAQAAIEGEQIGQDDITDFLAISFSSTDYVGHIFGLSSLEAEDNLLRLDRTLAKLLTYIDKHIGLKNTLIVLSADHGGPEAPGYLQSFGIDSGFVVPDEWDKTPSIAQLKAHFGIGKKLIKSFFPPYLYLNHDIIIEKNLDLAAVEQAVAKELMSIKGVALAVSSSALRDNKLPDNYLNRAAIRNYHRERSGDILVLFEPQYTINDFMGEKLAATHGSPWRYDTYVPVIFAGGNIKGQRISRRIEPIDIATTLANIMQTRPPSGSTGKVLTEVVKQY
jgi:predicted AlkP superfamily pyrophosphatase or phosphodiesterase